MLLTVLLTSKWHLPEVFWLLILTEVAAILISINVEKCYNSESTVFTAIKLFQMYFTNCTSLLQISDNGSDILEMFCYFLSGVCSKLGSTFI